jgi:hypothetical protein
MAAAGHRAVEEEVCDSGEDRHLAGSTVLCEVTMWRAAVRYRDGLSGTVMVELWIELGDG